MTCVFLMLIGLVLILLMAINMFMLFYYQGKMVATLRLAKHPFYNHLISKGYSQPVIDRMTPTGGGVTFFETLQFYKFVGGDGASLFSLRKTRRYRLLFWLQFILPFFVFLTVGSGAICIENLQIV